MNVGFSPPARRTRTLTPLLLLLLLCGCTAQPLERHEFSRLCMGVRARVVVYSPTEEHATAAAQAAFAELARLDSMMSDYQPASELSRLPAVSHSSPVRVSEDLYLVLSRASELSELTGGAFDVTLGPLTRLWRETRRSGTLPDQPTLDAARARSGYRYLELKDGTARAAQPEMQLDLGGIAKGFAAERAVQVLRSRSLPISLVALAGDVYAGDAPPGAEGWRVEIRGDRSGEDTPPLGILWLTRAGVSTSGDANQHAVVGGQRYSHILDPRTGLGVRSSRTVTVLAPRGMDADALSTALCVLDPAGARELLTRCQAAALIVDESGAIVVVDPFKKLRWHTQPVLR
ncbi:MAG: FAD:protein FMN transferase [Leptolyngbya sp. PLA1]|nr:FAD:protein FMN transferase [Leptolyngbya sp. PLA1]